MRPTTILRMHPTPVLIPQKHLGATIFHPRDRVRHAFWDEMRRQEGYIGLWKKGEWENVRSRPEENIKDTESLKRKIEAILNTPINSKPSTSIDKTSTSDIEMDITSQLSSNGNDDDHGHGPSKKGDEAQAQDMQIKKKVPAASVYWTDHLRML